ncbi:MAG: TraR/DksA family transcriptional regulator [Actinomycetes bacterium]
MDTATARQRLEQLLTDVDRSIATLEAESGRPSSSLRPDVDTADPGTALSDADREAAALETLSSHRAHLTEALARVDAGSYGKCLDCGAGLPDERLEARPEAARCVSCQARAENGR